MIGIVRETIMEDIKTYFQLESRRLHIPPVAGFRGQIEEIGQDKGLINVLTNRSSNRIYIYLYLAQNAHEPARPPSLALSLFLALCPSLEKKRKAT